MDPNRTKTWRIILYAALVLFLIYHLYYITAPPNGYHQWRESDTASITLNYYQDGLPFLTPRTNELTSSEKMVSVELPLYCYLGALGYHIFGDNHFAVHSLTVLAGLLCLGLLYGLVKILFDRLTASLAVWAIAFSPLFCYYSYKIMPDILMLCLGLAGMYLFYRFLEDNRYLFLILSALCLALAATLKPLILSVYLPLAVWLWQKKTNRKRNALLYLAYIVLTLGPLLSWIIYSGWLLDRSGAVSIFYQYLNSFFFKRFFLQWPFELWIGWVMVPAFISGLYWLFKIRKAGFYMVWLLASLIAVMLVARYSQHHDYYSLLFIPPLAIITGCGLKFLFDHGIWLRRLALVLLLLAPLGTYLRIKDRFGDTSEFYAIRKTAAEIIPPDKKVIVRDNTRGAVRLYELNRKGWYVNDGNDFDAIKQFIQNGAEYLLLEQSLDNFPDSLSLYFSDCDWKLGSLYCYPLNVKNKADYKSGEK